MFIKCYDDEYCDCKECIEFDKACKESQKELEKEGHTFSKYPFSVEGCC